MSHTLPELPVVADPSDAPTRRPVRRALVSVYDKTGLVELAEGLHQAGVEIVSTGSTAQTIAHAGIPVSTVEDLTGFPECLDGRVKTLHPTVHAGLLADTRRPEHMAQLGDLGIAPFELAIVNLYPFAATVATGAGPDQCVELIDIGGPSMVRGAAKNHPSVSVVVDPRAYPQVVAAVQAGGFTLAERRRLAAAAFAHTAAYDAAVASWFAEVYAPDSTMASSGSPDVIAGVWTRAQVLRYGENPHQRAAVYVDDDGLAGRGLAGARQRGGKEMSFNNYTDADAAWRAAHDHGDRPTVAVVKHSNPCGVAVGDDLAQAHRRAHACDPVSAYGGVIAANGPVTGEFAEQIAKVFTEVVVAPSFTDEALAVLAPKKNLRLLEVTSVRGRERRFITGGMVVQDLDAIDADGDRSEDWTLVAGDAADPDTFADLEFAWRAVRAAKSNAVLLAKEGSTVGIGMGQVNRVDSCRLAVERANTLADGADRARGSVAASDAFFPFADGAQILIDAGVKAIVQPGGSIRDPEVIEAAQRAGVTMYVTGARHFAH